MNNKKLITTVRKGCNPTTFTHEAQTFNIPDGVKTKFKKLNHFQSSFHVCLLNWINQLISQPTL